MNVKDGEAYRKLQTTYSTRIARRQRSLLPAGLLSGMRNALPLSRMTPGVCVSVSSLPVVYVSVDWSPFSSAAGATEPSMQVDFSNFQF